MGEFGEEADDDDGGAEGVEDVAGDLADVDFAFVEGAAPVDGANDLEVVVEAGGDADEADGERPPELGIDGGVKDEKLTEESGGEGKAGESTDDDGGGEGEAGVASVESIEGGDFFGSGGALDHGEDEEGGEGHDEVGGHVESDDVSGGE